MTGIDTLPPDEPPLPSHQQLLRARIRLADARRRLADTARIVLVVTAALVDAGALAYLVKHL